MAKRKKKSTKASESKAKLDGDLKVKRADEETPDGVVLGEGGSIKNATITVPAEEPKKTAPTKEAEEISQSIEVPEVDVPIKSIPIGSGKPRKLASVKVACVAIGQHVSLKNARGYSVEADVVKVEPVEHLRGLWTNMVTFRVCGSDAKLQEQERLDYLESGYYEYGEVDYEGSSAAVEREAEELNRLLERGGV